MAGHAAGGRHHGAHFVHTDLIEAKFYEANLKGATMEGVNYVSLYSRTPG
ncbi:MAG: pentapeptide repeat-containing protein [Sphingobium phenoxybenzoativorans]